MKSISIIIPYYKKKKYIQNTLNSIFFKFKTFNKRCRKKRYVAHKFFDYLCEKNNEIKRSTLDKLVTNLINTFIKDYNL